MNRSLDARATRSTDTRVTHSADTFIERPPARAAATAPRGLARARRPRPVDIGWSALGVAGLVAALLASSLPHPSDAAPRHGYTDCLWYAARNHGFYELQRTLASGGGSAAERDLWAGFVRSIGTEECGAPGVGIEPLARALAATHAEADRHFAGVR